MKSSISKNLSRFIKYNNVELNEDRIEAMIFRAKEYLDEDDLAEIRKNLP
jgi:hypothetical protein